MVLFNIFDLTISLLGSLILSILFLIIRILKRENLYYAIGGFLGVIFAMLLIVLNAHFFTAESQPKKKHFQGN